MDERPGAFYSLLGRYLVEFEHMCDAARELASVALRNSGLANDRLAGLLLARWPAGRLQQLIQEVVAIEADRLSDPELGVYGNLVAASLDQRNKDRNLIAHSLWHEIPPADETSDVLFAQVSRSVRAKARKLGAAATPEQPTLSVSDMHRPVQRQRCTWWHVVILQEALGDQLPRSSGASGDVEPVRAYSPYMTRNASGKIVLDPDCETLV